MYQIKNTIEDKLIHTFENANELIDFTRKIVIENEDFDFSILGMSDAIEYINDYCDNLELITNN